MVLSIMVLSIMVLSIIASIPVVLNVCFFIVMLSVFKLNVNMLSVVAPCYRNTRDIDGQVYDVATRSTARTRDEKPGDSSPTCSCMAVTKYLSYSNPFLHH
jgi:hypothetical protein